MQIYKEQYLQMSYLKFLVITQVTNPSPDSPQQPLNLIDSRGNHMVLKPSDEVIFEVMASQWVKGLKIEIFVTKLIGSMYKFSYTWDEKNEASSRSSIAKIVNME